MKEHSLSKIKELGIEEEPYEKEVIPVYRTIDSVTKPKPLGDISIW